MLIIAGVPCAWQGVATWHRNMTDIASITSRIVVKSKMRKVSKLFVRSSGRTLRRFKGALTSDAQGHAPAIQAKVTQSAPTVGISASDTYLPSVYNRCRNVLIYMYASQVGVCTL
jgi:hypothetical protein